MSHKQGIIALSPLILFAVLYLAASVAMGDFYKMPITVAFMLTCIYAIAIHGKKTVKERIDIFCTGAGEKNIMLMLCIFVLAGAFANSAKQAGSIEATVNVTLSVMPDNMILAGLFIAACFISLAIGTSVGTIVALTPIAVGLARSTGTDTALVTAVIAGGSFFGDNLSFISDTTVVATSTQGCDTKDKFLVNSYTTIPAAIAVMVMYLFIGNGTHATAEPQGTDYIKTLPYLIIIICAVRGMNVLAVLATGILATGAVGICYGEYDFYGWCQSMGTGIAGMGELLTVAVLAGGLLKLLSTGGALQYIISLMTKKIRSRRSCELTIAMLVSLVNVCTANNTVAILTVGSISREISGRYGVDSRKSASILDTFSCCTQSVLPYGAQILMATGLAAVSPIEILKYMYYPLTLFCVSVAAILLRYPKKYS